MKRLIFTICTGRCGTQLLAERLAEVPGVSAFHEPEPNFFNILPQVRSDLSEAVKFWKEVKLPAINETTNPIYVETSHLFCKGFMEGLLELNIVPDIILLSRPHREIASSLNRLDCIPGRNEAGRDWLLSPDEAGVLPIRNWEEMNNYQLCFWYCLEIERRQNAAAKTISSLGGRVIKTALNEIKTGSGMMNVINSLGLSSPKHFTKLKWDLSSRRRINQKKWMPEKIIPNNILDDYEGEVYKMVGFSEKKIMD